MRQLTEREKRNREIAIRHEKIYDERRKMRKMIAEYFAKLRDIMQEADNSDYDNKVLTRWSIKIEAKHLRDNRFDVVNRQVQKLESIAGKLSDEQIASMSRQLQRLGMKVKDNGQADLTSLSKSHLYIHIYDDGSVEIQPVTVPIYDFDVTGDTVESTTFVGNTHVWRSDEAVKPDHIVEDEPKKINFREFL